MVLATTDLAPELIHGVSHSASKKLSARVPARHPLPIERGIETLERQEGGIHEAIHAARKRFKRVRALYRLVEPMPVNSARGKMRAFATWREICLPYETQRLWWRRWIICNHRPIRRRTRFLADGAGRTSPATRPIASEAGHDLERNWQQHSIPAALPSPRLMNSTFPAAKAEPPDAWKSLDEAVRRAQRALSTCHQSRAEDAFHELRKCAQVYWMHLAVLRELWPSAFSAKEQEAKDLAAILGHEHDLSVLLQTINENTGLVTDSDSLAHCLPQLSEASRLCVNRRLLMQSGFSPTIPNAKRRSSLLCGWKLRLTKVKVRPIRGIPLICGSEAVFRHS